MSLVASIEDNLSADEATPVVVSAVDAFGNVDLTFAGQVAAVVTGPANNSLSATAVQGKTSFSLPLTVSGNYRFSASSAGILATTETFVVNPGVVTQLALEPYASFTVDDTASFRITAQDQHGNVQPQPGTNYTTTLSVLYAATSSLDQQLSVTVVAGEGIAIFQTEAPGLRSLVLQAVAGLGTSTPQQVLVLPGVIRSLVILDPVDGFVNRTTLVRVQGRDQFDNVATAASTNFVLTMADQETGAVVLTRHASLASGVSVANVSSPEPGTFDLSVSIPNNPTSIDSSSTQTVVFVLPPGKYPALVIQQRLHAILSLTPPASQPL